jgi:hypothetical protein
MRKAYACRIATVMLSVARDGREKYLIDLTN